MAVDSLTKRLQEEFDEFNRITRPVSPPITNNEPQGASFTDPIGGDLSKALQALQQQRPDVDDASLLDIAGAGLWTAFDTFLWGGPGLTIKALGAEQPYKWEEMSGEEKASAVVGGFAGIAAPWGPFSLLGKGASAVMKSSSVGSLTTAKKAISKISEAAPAGVLSTTGKKYFQKKTRDNLVGNIGQSLEQNVVKSNYGLRNLLKLGAGKEAGETAIAHLNSITSVAIKEGLKKSGVRANETTIKRLTDDFMKEITDGSHINSIDRWVEKLVGKGADEGLKSTMAKYLGMVAQDAVIIGAHTAIAGNAEAYARGEDFSSSDALTSTIYMSLAFPAIRAIGEGGNMRLQDGMKFLINKYNATNYQAMAKKVGQKPVRELLNTMIRGGHLDVVNGRTNSKFRDTIWNINGKQYSFSDFLLESERSLSGMKPKIPFKDVLALLDKIKIPVNQHWKQKWKSEYIADFAASLPRMALGVAAMNVGPFVRGEWDYMDKEELFAHMATAAAMTKGKGRWGEKEMQYKIQEFEGYYEVMDLMNVNSNNIRSTLNTYNELHRLDLLGSKIINTDTGQKILSAFDKNIEKHTTAKDFNTSTDKQVADFVSLYNVMKFKQSGSSRNHTFLDAKYLTRGALDRIKRELNSIEVEVDGKKIKISEFGSNPYEAVKNRLTIESADQNLELFKQYLTAIKEEVPGFGIDILPNGKVLFGDFNIPKDTDGGIQVRVEQLLRQLQKYGHAEHRADPSLRTNKWGADELEAVNRIWDAHMKSMNIANGINEDYPIDMVHNEYMSQIYDGGVARLQDKIHYLGTRNRDRLNESEQAFLSDYENVMMKNGLSAESTKKIRVIATKKEKGKDEKEIDLTSSEKESVEAKQKVETVKRDLDAIHRLMSFGEREYSKDEVVVKLEDGERLVKQYRKLFERLPESVTNRYIYHDDGMHYFMNRFLTSLDAPAETYVQIREGLATGYYQMDKLNGRILVPDRKAVELWLADSKLLDTDKGNRILKMHMENIEKLKASRVKIKEEPFQFVDVERPNTRTPNLNDIELIHSLSTRTALREFVRQGDVLNESLKTQDGYSSTLSDLQEKFSALNPENWDGGRINNLKGRIDEIKRIIDDIKSGYLVGNIEANKLNISELDKISKTADEIFKKHRPGDEKLLLEKDVPSLYKRLQSVSDAIKDLIDKNHESKNQLRTTIRKIQDLANTGKLSDTDIVHSSRELTNEMLRILGRDVNVSTQSLLELYQNMNQYRSWDTMNEFLVSLNKKIGQKVRFNTKRRDEEWEQNRRMLRSLEDRYTKPDPSKTPLKIAKRYNLMSESDPNQVKEEFLNDIVNVKGGNAKEYLSVFEKHVKDVIDKDTETWKTRNEKNEEWRRFKMEDAPYIINYADNAKVQNSVKIVNNNFEYDQLSPYQSNPLDNWINTYDVYHINDKGSFILPNRNQPQSLSIARNEVNMLDLVRRLNSGEVSIYNANANIEAMTRIGKGEVISMHEFLSQVSNAPLAKGREGAFIPMDLGANRRILFVATDKNVDKLNKDFSDWYNQFRSSLSGADVGRFETMFKHLIEKSGDRHLEAKMLALGANQFDKRFFNQYLSNNLWGKRANQKSIEDKFRKYILITAGGTTDKISENALKWMSSNSFPATPEFRQIIRDFMPQPNNPDRVRTGFFADEVNDTRNPFYTRDVVRRVLDAISRDNTLSDNERSIANHMLTDIQVEGKYPSLETSVIDGIKFVDTKMAKLAWGLKGHDLSDFNGMRPRIFHNTDNNALMTKGYFIYDPQVAARMETRGVGINILMGKSAAKGLSGRSLDGREIEPFLLKSDRNNWVDEIPQLPRNSQMDVNILNIGLGSLNLDRGKSSRSVSLTDFQSFDRVQEQRIWKGLDNLINRMDAMDQARLSGDPAFMEILFDQKELQGYQYTEGAMSLAERLLRVGMNTNNPLVDSSLRRLFRQNMFHILRDNVDEYAVSPMIAPDVNSKLSVPAFTNVMNNVTNSEVGRIPLWAGGTKISLTQANKKIGGRIGAPVDDENGTISFIYRSQGVDLLISGHQNAKKKWNFYNPNQVEEFLGRRDRNSDIQNFNPDFRSARHSQKKALAEEVIKELASIKDDNLTYGNVFELVEQFKNNQGVANYNGNQIQLRLSGSPRQRKEKAELLKNMKFHLIDPAHAIPRKSPDILPHRVEAIGEKTLDHTYGNLTAINAWDARIGHQRDYDGDKLWMFLNMNPKHIYKNWIQSGQVVDFQPLEKQQIDINPFGMATDAGRNSGKIFGDDNAIDRVGFRESTTQIENSKRAIAMTISAKRSLTWLSNLGFTLNGEKMIDINRPFDSNSDIATMRWKSERDLKQRLYNMIQSSLDHWGGVDKDIFASPESAVNAMIYGIMPDRATTPGQKSEWKNRGFGENANESSLIRGLKGDPSGVQGDMVRLVLRDLGRAAIVNNDTWDEAGSRLPETMDLTQTNYRLNQLFRNPNQYVFNTLLKRYLGLPSKDGNKKIQDLLLAFFPSADKSKMGDQKFIKDFVQGYMKNGKVYVPMEKVIDFGLGKGLTQDQKAKIRMESSDQGFIINKLLERQMFDQRDAFGEVPTYKKLGRIVEFGKDYKARLSNFTTDLVDRVELLSLLTDTRNGRDLLDLRFEKDRKILEANDRDDMTWSFKFGKDDLVGASELKAQRRGAVLNLLEHHKNSLSNRVKFFEGIGKASTDQSFRDAVNRLSSTEMSIELIKAQATKDLVADVAKGKVKVLDSSFLFSKGDRRSVRYQNLRKDTYVYSIDNINRSIDKSLKQKNGQDVLYDMLKPEGYFKSGEQYKMKRNKLYVEVSNPVIKESSSAKDLRWNIALLKMTLDAEPNLYNPMPRSELSKMFPDISQRTRFENEAMQLKKLINTNQYMSTMLSKDNRNNSIAAYRSASSRNQLEIEQFLRRWGVYRDPALMGPFTGTQPGQTNMERFQFVFKYLVRPDAMAGKYSTVSTEAGSIDIPYYKSNRNMISELVNFSGRNPEMRKYVDGFMKNWDTLYRGGSLEKEYEVDMMKSSYKKNYGVSDMPFHLVTLAESITGYTTPSLRHFFRKNGAVTKGREIERKLDDQTSIWIRSIKDTRYEAGYCK